MKHEKDKEVKDLEERIESLEYEISLLKKSIHSLSIVSTHNPRYPYWSKLLCFEIYDDKRVDFEFALSLLSDRVFGNQIIVKDNDDITEEMFTSSNCTIILKSKAEKFPESLFTNSIPAWDDASKILSSILGIHSKMIEEILISMREQGMFTQLINHFFSQND